MKVGEESRNCWRYLRGKGYRLFVSNMISRNFDNLARDTS
jgi:hypothetical protein